MYILYSVEFPNRRVPRTHVENAWTGAGLPQPVPSLGGAEAGPDELKNLVLARLTGAGATPMGGNGDLEVPRSSGKLLAQLEEFYHRVYPETRNVPGRGHFTYEEVEWLGEF